MLKSAPINQATLWRYDDVTFILIDKSPKPQFYAYINNQKEGSIYTKEEEDEHQLPFHDCLISRIPDVGFTSKIYRQPTATVRFLGFDSHHPLTLKRSWIKCLPTRERYLCSTKEAEKAKI